MKPQNPDAREIIHLVVGDRLGKKPHFIRLLAEFLCRDEMEKNIMAAVSKGTPGLPRFAEEWVKLRQASPLFGWTNIEEAEKILREFPL